MSHVALRRVMIRLLHDPALVDRLHTDADRALAGLDLDAEERGWLLAAPRGAWAADPARPARVLAALEEEYPATSALAADHAARFFASEEFHDAVQQRGSLALAFGAHAMRFPDARVRVVAALEQAIAAARRAPRRAESVAAVECGEGAGRDVRLAPSVRVVRVPTGALALLGAVRAGTELPALGTDEEAVLVVAPADGGDATIEPLAPELATLLTYAGDGRARTALLTEARRLGADAGEDAEIVDGLLADGLLVVDPRR